MADRGIDGMDALLKRLERLPGKLQNRVMKAATRSGARVVLKRIVNAAPRGDGLDARGRPRPHLADTFIQKAAKLDRRTGFINVIVGSVYPKAPHGTLVVDGTAAHAIPAGRGVRIGPIVVRGVIRHPGAKPNDFVTRGMLAAQGEAFSRMESRLKAGLEREAARA